MTILVVLILVGAAFFMNQKTGTTSNYKPYANWEQYDSLFIKWANQYSVQWEWLKAIALNETLLGNEAKTKAGEVSSDGKSWGLMQITKTTGEWLVGDTVTPEMLNNPDFSIQYAAKYVRLLWDIFPGDQRKIVMSYNQGQGNTIAGKEYAAEYYERFKRNLARVEKYQ